MSPPETYDPVQSKDLDTIFNYDSYSDSAPIEKQSFSEPAIYDLPWTNVSIDPMKSWLPPPPNRAEAWYMDPVELAARRYEWRGAKEEASMLRAKFQPLSLLHRWVLQWHIWAEKQQAAKDPPKETKINSRSISKGTTTAASRVSSYEKPRVKFIQYPEWATDTSLKVDHLGSSYINEPPTVKFNYAQGLSNKISLSTPQEDQNRKGKHNQKSGGQPSTQPTSAPTAHHRKVEPEAINIVDIPLKPCVLDTERIIPQVLKDRVFHGHFPNGLGSLDTDDINKDSDVSVAYRTHARWVLNGNFMSDDSEDDDITETSAAPHIFHEPQGCSSEEFKKLLQPSPDISHDSAWNDPFFLEDSGSSNFSISDSSLISNDGEFPVISGEELEKILEEAKGTTQFHKWQNAHPSMHQKEFKKLINLHRFATESEAKNQKRWRSKEKMEKSGNTRTTTDSGFLGSSEPSSPTTLGQDPSFSSSTSMKPNSEIDALAESYHTYAQPDTVGIMPKSIPKQDDYTCITHDDIKFLRELKRKFSEGALIHQTSTEQEFIPQTEAIPVKPPQKTVQDNLSLRDVFMTAKPFPSISYRIDHEYTNMFSRCNKDQENNNLEQLQKGYDGPAPKRHHMTTPFGDVSFHPGSADYHPFFHTTKSSIFKKLVVSTGRFWNLGANISLSGFWVTERLFITALNFHPWAPSTVVQSFQDQIEDFESRNNGIDIFVSNGYLNWSNPNDDPEAIKVILRAWDISARIAIFEPEDKQKVAKDFVGIDMLIEEDTTPVYSGANIATIGYNPMEAAKNDPLGLRILIPGHRSVTFGDITICGGLHKNRTKSSSVFARLDSGFSHGAYGRMCVVIERSKESGFIIGIVSGQCEEQGLNRPEALSDFVSTFPIGFKAELRRLLKF
ncbi:uncharacterized protein LAJ45_00565 [Morchella importuna]|uniref:uncharacterized protein n=1 Tax=Morchella importuna TaxID=1174673 RepID=UPI001E8E1F85|nr:uncharacterized protein LAJ45_00565 [Morchella importuna]KAH8155555.1 hypothetical protein LAJ45_00565 [Morchella importuna]